MIFPGQGSQFVGMGKEFYDHERISQELFELASSCLKKNFVKLCFASSERELKETANAQTSIFLISSIIVRLLKERYEVVPDLVAGHSLGEYSALFAAGGINFVDALYLLNKRAQFMEEATQQQNGGMLAVLRMSGEKLRAIVDQIDQPDGLEHVAEIVNFNSPDQLVVSGTLPELEAVQKAVASQKGKAVFLKVAGAFHSRLMREAEERFGAYLTKVDIHSLEIPLITNIAAKSVTSAKQMKDALVRQISSPVLWWQSMQKFKNCDVIIQVGPGTVYASMLHKSWPDKKIFAINEQKDINDLLVYVGKPELVVTYEKLPDEPAQ